MLTLVMRPPKQTGLQKYHRVCRLVQNGMDFDEAIKSVGIGKTYYWRIGKRLRKDAFGEETKAI